MLYLWLKFIIAAVIVLWAGGRLIKYGDIIAEHTGLNKLWIGVALLGVLTSLPEISSGISAVTTIKIPNLAIATLFGACLINMLIIALLDIIYNFYGRGPLLKDMEEETGHVMTAGLAIILLAIAGLGVLVGKILPPISLFGLGSYSIAIAIIFLFSQGILFHFERRDEQKFLDRKVKKLELHDYKSNSLFASYVKFTFYALLVVAAASLLPILGAEISLTYGLTTTLVGALLIGLVTTLPELAIAISAIMVGSLDVAVGLLFASSVFNMAIIFVVDLFTGEVPLLPLVSLENAIVAVFAIIATAVAMLGVVYRSERHIFRRIGWDAFGILLTVVVAVYLLFRVSLF